jgi:hypothetical protein
VTTDDEAPGRIVVLGSEPPPEDGDGDSGATTVGEAAYELLAQTMSFDGSRVEERPLATTKPPPAAGDEPVKEEVEVAPLTPLPSFPDPPTTEPSLAETAPAPGVAPDPPSPTAAGRPFARTAVLAAVIAMALAAVVYFFGR